MPRDRLPRTAASRSWLIVPATASGSAAWRVTGDAADPATTRIQGELSDPRLPRKVAVHHRSKLVDVPEAGPQKADVQNQELRHHTRSRIHEPMSSAAGCPAKRKGVRCRVAIENTTGPLARVPTSQAFTLIELLVVIAIIAV